MPFELNKFSGVVLSYHLVAAHVPQVSISQAEWVRLAREVIVNTLFEKSGLQLKLTLSRQGDKVRTREVNHILFLPLSLPLNVSQARLATAERPVARRGRVFGVLLSVHLL